jgi:hypothetical protein
MAIEYTIWGCEAESSEERVLVSGDCGKVKSMAHAEQVIKMLHERYGAHSMRVQTIDLADENMGGLADAFRQR